VVDADDLDPSAATASRPAEPATDQIPAARPIDPRPAAPPAASLPSAPRLAAAPPPAAPPRVAVAAPSLPAPATPPAPADDASVAAAIAKALAEAVVPERTDELATVVDPRPRVRTPTGMRGLGDVPLLPPALHAPPSLPHPLERAPPDPPPLAAGAVSDVAGQPALHDDDTGPKQLVAGEPLVLRQSRSGEILASTTARDWEPDEAPPPRTTPPRVEAAKVRVEAAPPGHPGKDPSTALVRLPEGRRPRSPAQEPTELVQSPPPRPRRRLSTGLVVGSCMIVVAGVVAALLILFR
jgi:hypothetical protein